MLQSRSLGTEKIHVEFKDFEFELCYDIIEEIDEFYGNNFIKLEFVEGSMIDAYGNITEFNHSEEPKNKEILKEKKELKLRYM